jgi:hypothetical protein
MTKQLPSLLLFCVSAAQALDTTRWQTQAAIQIPGGASGIAAVKLTRDIYVHSRPDLADLRVVRGGEEVPYLMEVRRGAVEFREIEPAVVNQSVVLGRGLQCTLDLGTHFQHSRIRISTGEINFRQKVRIETSNNLRSWAIARDDGYIFDFSQGDRHMALLTVDYPASTMRYVRVTVLGWMKTTAIRQVWSAYRNERPAERDVMATVQPQRSEDRETKASVLLVDLKQSGVPYDRIRMESGPGYYFRAVELETSADAKDWRFLASGTIYQTDSENSSVVAVGERHDRYLRVRIFNQDDKPIPVNNIVLENTVRVLKFRIDEGPSFIFTGNSDAKPPSYDLAPVLAREAPQPEVRADLLAAAANPWYRLPPPPVKPWSERYPQFLYGTLAVAILVMGYITVGFLLKVKNTPK